MHKKQASLSQSLAGFIGVMIFSAVFGDFCSAQEFEMPFDMWTLEGKVKVISLQSIPRNKEFSIGYSCSKEGYAMVILPVEPVLTTDYVSLQCEKSGWNAILHSQRYENVLVISRFTDSINYSKLLAVQDIFGQNGEQCSVRVGDRANQIPLGGLISAMPAFKASCAARGY